MTSGEPLRTGLRRATRWRLLVLCAVLSAVPAALATLPVWQLLSGLLDHAPRAALLAAGLESSWFPELARALAERPAGLAIPGGLLSALVVALLVAPVLSGAMLAEAGSDHPLRIRPLLTGAGRYYGRMFRTTLVGLVPLGLAGLVALAVRKGVDARVARSVTEAGAVSTELLGLTVVGVVVVLAHLTIDAARARFAARPDRRSALLAWLAGTWLVLRRPVQAGSIALAGLLCGPVLGLVFMALRERVPAGSRGAIVVAVVLAQLAAAAVGWGRAVRLVALTRLARLDAEERLARRAAVPPGA